MRYLAVDLGDRRTGLALGDSETRIASPLAVLEVPVAQSGGAALISAIRAEADESVGGARSAFEVVVGLPINMDGTEGPRAAAVRAFAERLGTLLERPVHLFDERLSSVTADRLMSRTGLTRGKKKERRDAIAAAVVLQSFLDGLPRQSEGTADSRTD